MAQDSLVVNTKNGALKGSVYKSTRGDTIYCYEGIPYGKPPVGELRFADPVPAEPWQGVRSAEKAPPAATTATLPTFADFAASESSEDCLYLNIFTPKLTKENVKVPVMVFIHGGGFMFGTGNKDFCGPDYLVPHGVILVTVNYRLGAFGFLSFQTSECPGNFGLKDQSLGMRWVKENIAAFGGDSSNITLFGESAGGASVHYQTLSPLSRGLFNRCIALSGSALNRWAYSRFPVESASLLAEKVGCPNPKDPHEAFQFLKNAPMEEINKHAAAIFTKIEGIWAGENLLNFSFVPTAEPEGTPNAFLTKTPAKAIEDGDFADVPYISGVCSDEAIFSVLNPDYVPDWNDITTFEKLLPKELGQPLGSKKSVEAAEKLKAFYFPKGSTQEGYIRACSMLSFVYGVYHSVKGMVKNANKKTENYLYKFEASREPSAIKKLLGCDKIKGSSHGDDMEYLFVVKAGLISGEPIKENTRDDKVKNTLTTLWTNFAKTGEVDPEWKPVTENDSDPYIAITDTIEPQTGFFAEEIKFWDGIYQFFKNN